MKRYLAIDVPSFRLERCGYGLEERAVLVGQQGGEVRVLASTPGARRAGIRRGTGLAEARATVPDLLVEWLDPEGERADWEALGQVFRRLSDRVRTEPYRFWVVEVERCAAVHGGEAGMLRAARALAHACGHRVGLALTDDPRGAVILARHDRGRIVPGSMGSALASLPIADARPRPSTLAALHAVGITTFAQLARLDRAGVGSRLGAEGVALHRLAVGEAYPRTWGVAHEALGEPVAVVTDLGGVCDTAPLFEELPSMIGRLVQRLEERGRAAVRLLQIFELEEGDPIRMVIRLGQPCRSPEVLRAVLAARLERVRGPAPIERWRIEVVKDEPFRGRQPGLFRRAEEREALPDLVERLRQELGAGSLFRATLCDAWRPESGWERISVEHDALQLGMVTPERGERVGPVRPPSVLAAPEPVDVKGEPPVCVRLREGWLPVRRSEGPERLSGAWWDPDQRWERSYWSVELVGGRRAWLYRDDRWWLHGWF